MIAIAPSTDTSTAPQTVARLPFDIGVLHFIGIGGIGMSGIAEIMHNLGYQGPGQRHCQLAPIPSGCERLGVPVCIGHAAENLGEAAVVVVSSAIDPQQCGERCRARAKYTYRWCAAPRCWRS